MGNSSKSSQKEVTKFESLLSRGMGSGYLILRHIFAFFKAPHCSIEKAQFVVIVLSELKGPPRWTTLGCWLMCGANKRNMTVGLGLGCRLWRRWRLRDGGCSDRKSRGVGLCCSVFLVVLSWKKKE